MNIFTGIGRLVRDPEFTYTANQKGMCKFTLAIDRPVAKGAEKQTDYIGCIVFGPRAETIGNYVSKGQRIAIEGSLRVDSYTGKDGVKRTSSSILVNNFYFIEKRGSNSQSGGGFGDMGTSFDAGEVSF